MPHACLDLVHPDFQAIERTVKWGCCGRPPHRGSPRKTIRLPGVDHVGRECDTLPYTPVLLVSKAFEKGANLTRTVERGMTMQWLVQGGVARGKTEQCAGMVVH